MTGDKIQAGAGHATGLLIKIAATRQTCGQLRDGTTVAFPKAPQAIAIRTVPLGPEHRKVANLITARAEVPGLSDQLHLRDHGVLVDDVEKGTKSIDLKQLAGQGAA